MTLFRWLRSVHSPTLIFCCVILSLSIWPGFFSNVAFWGTLFLPFLLVFVVLSLVGILCLEIVRIWINQTSIRNPVSVPFAAQPEPVRGQRRSKTNTFMAVVFAALLLFLQVPRRLGFLISWPFFEHSLKTTVVQRIEDLKENGSHQAAYISPDYLRARGYRLPGRGQWTGIYYISSIGVDAHGGTYFVAGFSGFFSLHAFHGFAHRPHSNNTPFGKENYHTRRIFGDWYLFKVTDETFG